MCTSIVTNTLDGKHILSRTMDFSKPLDPNPVFIPRNYQWISDADRTAYQAQYGFVGAGRKLSNTFFVADGVNEHGLAIAELYLPGNVRYQENAEVGMRNLAPHEFILWVLGNCRSIAEVEMALADINIMEIAIPELSFVAPLHWILTESGGESIVIEPTTRKLAPKKNPVGVMTNTPNLEWHIENLRNYLNVRPQQYDSVSFGTYNAIPFSQGTGTSGLPGGFTPPERFVRAAFFKEHIEPAPDELSGIANAHRILSTVRIPKGVVVTQEGTPDYSLYVSSMCNESCSYYFTSYENNRVSMLTISEELLQQSDPVVFKHPDQEDILRLN